MHKTKSPPFAEKGGLFFEGVSMSSLFYETVKNIIYFA